MSDKPRLIDVMDSAREDALSATVARLNEQLFRCGRERRAMHDALRKGWTWGQYKFSLRERGETSWFDAEHDGG